MTNKPAELPTPDEIECSKCGKQQAAKPTAKGAARLPAGWKRFQAAVWCRECWKKTYCIRAVTISVASPAEGTWPELMAAIKPCWRGATRMANWAVQQLYAAEPPRSEKITRHPMPYLYPGARAVAPETDPTSTTSLLQAVQRKYMARRLDIWRCSMSLPNYRYPVPYPIHTDAWGTEKDEDGRLMIWCRLGRERRRIYLRGGHEFARQTKIIERIHAGELLSGELAIYQRPFVAGKANPLLVKIAVWLPKKREEQRGKVLAVRTGSPALWTYRIGNDDPRYLYADHLDRWIISYENWREHLAHDTKAEKRRPKAQTRGFEEARTKRARKHKDRMDSFLHMSAAMLIGYAQRNCVAKIDYSDADKSRFASFPWAQLRSVLADKAALADIEFDASGEVISESPEPLEV